METRQCETCGARWMGGQHYWTTGKPGNELDLAGLVCNNLQPEKPCANPSRGQEGGQTWESRMREVNKALERGGL
jgi:hypothetical protein